MEQTVNSVSNGTGVSAPPLSAGRGRLMKIQEVSQYLGVSVHTIYTMVSQRRIPFVKVGRLLRFDQKRLEEWIKRHSVMPIDRGRE